MNKYQKNIFNKNDNNVGLLRTVKGFGYKKNAANNKIEIEPSLRSGRITRDVIAMTVTHFQQFY